MKTRNAAHSHATDPVCGALLPRERAVASMQYEGTWYFFCSVECFLAFGENPDLYIEIRTAASPRDREKRRDSHHTTQPGTPSP